MALTQQQISHARALGECVGELFMSVDVIVPRDMSELIFFALAGSDSIKNVNDYKYFVGYLLQSASQAILPAPQIIS